MADSYANLIGESLAAIAAEAPSCFAAVSPAASDLTFTISIDGEEICLVADPLLRLAAPTPRADVRVATSSAAISAILEGKTTIEALALNDYLHVQGNLVDIARGHDVLLRYVHGAVRSPSVPRLRERFDERSAAGS